MPSPFLKSKLLFHNFSKSGPNASHFYFLTAELYFLARKNFPATAIFALKNLPGVRFEKAL